MKAAEAQLVAIDFESTGPIAGYPDEPWQIGLVTIRQGRVAIETAREFLIRVSPDRPFNPCAPGSWRTQREQLAEATSLPELLPDLRGHVLGVPLVAHNAATEKKLLRQAWPLQRPGPWIDTLKLARLALPNFDSYDLESVMMKTGLTRDVDKLVPGRCSHDALYDAVSCAVLLCFLLEQPGWQSITVSELTRAASRARKGRS